MVGKVKDGRNGAGPVPPAGGGGESGAQIAGAGPADEADNFSRPRTAAGNRPPASRYRLVPGDLAAARQRSPAWQADAPPVDFWDTDSLRTVFGRGERFLVIAAREDNWCLVLPQGPDQTPVWIGGWGLEAVLW